MESMLAPLIRQADLRPDRVALIDSSGRLTYRELLGRVYATARALRRLGVEPGDRVAYLLENRSDLVVTFYASQALGAVAAPVHVRSVAREIALLTRATGAKLLVYSALRAAEAEAAQALHPVTLACVDDRPGVTNPAHSSEASTPLEPPSDPEAISRIMFTGGSTGAPKGAMRSHRADLVNIDGTAAASFLADGDDAVCLVQCPIDHHAGHTWFTMSLALGATVVLGGAFRAEETLGLIDRHRVTHSILLPPTTYVRLLEDPAVGRFDLGSLRVLQTSAGAASAEFVRLAYDHFPHCRISYGWGQTESGLGSTHVLERDYLATGDPRLGSVGRPMRHVEMRLVGDDGCDVAAGVTGECWLRSEAVMSGYWDQPELTAEVLPGDGWLRTGDMMSQDADGYYYLRYRRRELIKSGGENVFAAEVEQVIALHPAVADCAVYGLPHTPYGEGVAATVELKPGRSLTLAELQAWTRRHLASYKKPVALRLVARLERDLAGKVDKRELARLHAAGAGAPSRPADPARPTAPSHPTEPTPPSE
jgi:acyl-CoA synthetase (AMP-forming)/AMP-acid ligase II